MISRFARTWRGALLAFASVAGLGLTACHRDMYDQPKFMPNSQTIYFPNEQSNRLPPAHTVARGAFDDGSTFYTGKMGNALATSFPMPVTPRLVARGREMFNIECTACHGRDGYGDGIVVQRGFPQPPSYHIDRLRQAPVGHFFVVITDGYGAMYPFGSRISPADRWAIVAYIRALQFSQDAPSGELTDADRAALEKNK
jgi:mono/diheme cytochrome c family protein